MSTILIVAKGEKPCKFPKSTVFSWLHEQKRMANEHVSDITDRYKEFDTQPECDDGDPELQLDDTKTRQNTRTGRLSKIKEEHQWLGVGWRALHKKSTAIKLQIMFIYHMRGLAEPKERGFWFSESSIRRILNDISYIWKASRHSIATSFTPETAIAFISYTHAFRQLHELTGSSEDRKVWYSETSQCSGLMKFRLWYRHEDVLRRELSHPTVGWDGNGGLSIFLFINGSGGADHVDGNIAQSHFQFVVY